MFQDTRYGLRLLARNPGFTAVAVLTLALGIGANTSVFSVVRAVLLPPLPFADPGRLVQIAAQNRKTGEPSNWTSYRDVADWRAQSRSFESIGVHRFALVNLAGEGQADALYGARASADLLPLLGVAPLLGRFFTPAEDQPKAGQVIVLSYDLWQRHFAADRSVVGRTIRLTAQRAQDYVVIGVMPRGFNFPLTVPSAVRLPSRQMAFWIPFGVDPWSQSRDGLRCLVAGRLKAGVTRAQAQADLEGVAARIERESPQTNAGVGVRVLPLAHAVMGRARPAMLIMLGAAGLLVLIACANIANLMLARALNRKRETGIRLALGADRNRLLRQWITESLLLAMAGGAVGLVLAAAGLRSLVALAPGDIPRLSETRLDGGVLLFTLGLSMLAGLLFGVFPAWLAAGTDPQDALAEGGARSTGPRRGRVRDALVVGEVALSVLLTIGAGLLVTSFIRLLREDPGFRADRVMTAIIVLQGENYRDQSADVAFYRKLLDRVREIPGVETAGAVNGVPLSGNITGAYVQIEGHPSVSSGVARQSIEVFSASEDYPRTMGIALVAGRGLTRQDAAAGMQPAVINELAAQCYWPGENAIGKRLAVNRQQGREVWREVVGIVKTTHDQSLDLPAQPAVYLPLEQGQEPPQFLAVRTSLPVAEISARLRQAVAAVDKDQPVYVINAMQDLLDASVAPRRFASVMLALFGMLALVLAAAGIYGVTAYAVSRRTREIGLRLALGARRGDVLRLIVGQGMRLTGLGIVLGVAAAAALTRSLASLLYGVSALDPAIFVVVPLVLSAVGLLACSIPARRAIGVDPTVALRCE